MEARAQHGNRRTRQRVAWLCAAPSILPFYSRREGCLLPRLHHHSPQPFAPSVLLAMSHPVQLYIYDLSNGMARMLSRQLTGTHFDAIYHTSVVVHGVEWFFGAGIQSASPGKTHVSALRTQV